MIKILNNKHKAAVSLFVVVFATLLITVVTVSFARLMVKSQQQATTTDLSQSAYDSALAGVEDAKRALIEHSRSANLDTTNWATTCNESLSGLGDLIESGGEIDITTGGNNNKLDQAYTCVKIRLNTADYLGSLSKDESKLIPLSSTGPFSKVKIQWFNNSDTNSIDLISPSGVTPLRTPGNWAVNVPPILRAQLIQFGDSFTLSSFDSDSSGNAETLFLYPADSGINEGLNFNKDSHVSGSNAPVLIDCDDRFSFDGYACSVTIDINGSMNNKLLRLSSIYNHTNYRIVLLDDLGAPVEFKAVQPEIDSTGRTNDMFRRVKSRVELNTDFPYPEATIDITGNLCKDFIVTDNADHYKINCTP